MFEKLIDSLESSKIQIPSHLGIVLYSINDQDFAKKKNIEFSTLLDQKSIVVKNIIDYQIKLQIKTLTLQIFSDENLSDDNYEDSIDFLVRLMNYISKDPIIANSGMKVNIIGRWYNLPARLTDKIRSVIEKTMNNNSLVLNLCINYDGRDEIVDAVRLISRSIQSGKLSPEAIDRQSIKKRIYFSDSKAPDIIIKTDDQHTPNLLMWDAPGKKIQFTDKHWFYFSKNDLIKALS